MPLRDPTPPSPRIPASLSRPADTVRPSQRIGRRSFRAVAYGIESAVVVAVLVLGVAVWGWQEHQTGEQAAAKPAPSAATEAAPHSPALPPSSSPAATPPQAKRPAERPSLPAQTSPSPAPPASSAVPAAAGPGPASTSLRSNDLYYRWQLGQQYSYRISCKAEIGDTLLELTGTNTYTVGQSPVPISPGPGSESRQGSGTAFVVSRRWLPGHLRSRRSRCDGYQGNARQPDDALHGGGTRQHSRRGRAARRAAGAARPPAGRFRSRGTGRGRPRRGISALGRARIERQGHPGFRGRHCRQAAGEGLPDRCRGEPGQ